MAEQFTRNEQVVSSILTISSKTQGHLSLVFFVFHAGPKRAKAAQQDAAPCAAPSAKAVRTGFSGLFDCGAFLPARPAIRRALKRLRKRAVYVTKQVKRLPAVQGEQKAGTMFFLQKHGQNIVQKDEEKCCRNGLTCYGNLCRIKIEFYFGKG